jgi:hypothetical protein
MDDRRYLGHQRDPASGAGCGFEFDAEEYWSFVRGDPAQFLGPNPEALALLKSLPHMKKVVTPL